MIFRHNRMRSWQDGFGQAVLALRDNRLRTILSILGIAVGIAAVMAIGSISKGGHFMVFKELETFGLKSVWVWGGKDDANPNRVVRKGTGIDDADFEALKGDCCPAVRRISPIVKAYGLNSAVHVGNNYSNGILAGVGYDYLAINNDTLSVGFGFKPGDFSRSRNVVIIGKTVADNLFDNISDLIGREIRIGVRKYTVVGVLDSKSRDLLKSIGSGGGDDPDNRILIPYKSMQLQFGSKYIDTIQAEAIEYTQADTAAAQIVTVLEHRHNRQYTYRTSTMAQYISTANRILHGVSLIGVLAASISLLVGGMGIMNIVSTSVLERTREIGLRKAVGATRGHILFQFLMESVILSMIGGGIGLFLGVLTSVILALITGFPLVPSLFTIVIALVVSIGIGLLSGYYPASRASKLRPVIALRYE